MSRIDRKERRKFFISVEGESCEKQYFEHLQRLINTCPKSKYNVNFVIKAKVTPRQMIKRYGSMPVDKDAQGKPIPYMHVADIENYYDLGFRKHFFDLLDEMKVIKKESGKAYLMGYSNLTFDLWMLLHVDDMNASVTNRDKYLNPINRGFNKRFSRLDDYKDHDEFEKILEEFVTLDSIRTAICRAEEIRKWSADNNKEKCNHNGFCFYKDNPDTTVDEVIKKIFEVCGI